nr:unnamed protein product [Digitaria exilis]
MKLGATTRWLLDVLVFFLTSPSSSSAGAARAVLAWSSGVIPPPPADALFTGLREDDGRRCHLKSAGISSWHREENAESH